MRKSMNKIEAKSILDDLLYTSIGDHLFQFDPHCDPNFQYHSESDGPYTGDLTYHFAMSLLGMAFSAFDTNEIKQFGYTPLKERYDEWINL
jgi:hypothetical protein